MKILFPTSQRKQALLIRIPKVWDGLPCAMIEDCLRECGGPQLNENVSVVYLVQTPEPWTESEHDYLRQIAEKKLNVPTTEGGR